MKRMPLTKSQIPLQTNSAFSDTAGLSSFPGCFGKIKKHTESLSERTFYSHDIRNIHALWTHQMSSYDLAVGVAAAAAAAAKTDRSLRCYKQRGAHCKRKTRRCNQRLICCGWELTPPVLFLSSFLHLNTIGTFNWAKQST